ncbi:N-acetylglucosamine-6-phosphate deacetylase [Peribacillus sp. SCS-155]|uniref:N-acetylglucosamine-6-phosphate deacetylase n=1 Tax=Peribacillus sedimenti TaxID=3115297 RepID=UPI003906847E
MKTDSLLLYNAQVYLEEQVIDDGFVYIQDGAIVSAGPIALMPKDDAIKKTELEQGSKIIPGFIDVHIHGAAGADTMDGTKDALETIATQLPAEGTTSFLATTITQGKDRINQALKNVAKYLQTDNLPGKAEILGVHLEGPFINPSKKGAQPENHIINPDLKLFDEWQKESGDSIRLVTSAPEQQNGISFIKHLTEKGIISSIGHSDATFEQVKDAVAAGSTHVTHLFNGMRGLHHREPGLAGAAILMEKLKAEIIADGVHVSPEMVKLAVKAKGTDGVILITDSMRAKCLKNGHYDLGGQDVTVADGKALLSDGTLAGSILKMIDSVSNIIEFTGLELEDAIMMASVNPAKQLGIYNRKGSISPGKDADIAILNQQNNVVLTYCRGKEAYRAK